jgi:two-component system response regulator DegU
MWFFLDIEMPIWDGRKTLVELKNKFPDLLCNMLSMNNEKAIIDDCISKGASGYLSKDCTLDELQEAIINSAEIYFSKEVLKHLSGYGKTKGEQQFLLIEPLTEREVEVLTFLCDGLSPKEIANKINLSPRTVETHKTAIMQKFDVNSVGKLISVAIKNKVISI